jgi:hypothetical protein
MISGTEESEPVCPRCRGPLKQARIPVTLRETIPILYPVLRMEPREDS